VPRGNYGDRIQGARLFHVTNGKRQKHVTTYVANKENLSMACMAREMGKGKR